MRLGVGKGDKRGQLLIKMVKMVTTMVKIVKKTTTLTNVMKRAANHVPAVAKPSHMIVLCIIMVVIVVGSWVGMVVGF